jgi:hypothetical protein
LPKDLHYNILEGGFSNVLYQCLLQGELMSNIQPLGSPKIDKKQCHAWPMQRLEFSSIEHHSIFMFLQLLTKDLRLIVLLGPWGVGSLLELGLTMYSQLSWKTSVCFS